MKKITKRDVAFFFIGIITMLIIDAALDWDNTVKDFKAGYNSTQSKTEQIK